MFFLFAICIEHNDMILKSCFSFFLAFLWCSVCSAARVKRKLYAVIDMRTSIAISMPRLLGNDQWFSWRLVRQRTFSWYASIHFFVASVQKDDVGQLIRELLKLIREASTLSGRWNSLRSCSCARARFSRFFRRFFANEYSSG